MLPIFLHIGGNDACFLLFKGRSRSIRNKENLRLSNQSQLPLICHVPDRKTKAKEIKLFFQRWKPYLCRNKIKHGNAQFNTLSLYQHVSHMGNCSSSKPHSNRVKVEKSVFHGGRHIKAKVKTWVLCSSSELASDYLLHIGPLPLLL